MKFNVKIYKTFLIILLMLGTSTIAQSVQNQFYKDSISVEKINFLNKLFGQNKIYDSSYKKQILITLSYFPELKNVKIKFRFKKTNTPLSSRPTFWSLFLNAKNRSYIVTISTQSRTMLEPILLKNLTFNAQIGVLGHEIAHISDYNKKSFVGLLNLLAIEITSKNQVDKFESRVDNICINHGLGYQLLDWSKQVRQNLNLDFWRGADNYLTISKKERYLNPQSIILILNKNPLYQFTDKN